MQSRDEFPPPSDQVDGPADHLAASARGWHRIQLAVLGFIGFCGVMWAGGNASGPSWAQWSSGALVVLALALACLGIYLVGRVAYPFYGPGAPAGADTSTGGTARLRAGITLTYLALIVLVVATLSAWWPDPAQEGAVQVQDVTGQAWCGRLADAPVGGLALETEAGPVTVPLDRLAVVRPVDGC